MKKMVARAGWNVFISYMQHTISRHKYTTQTLKRKHQRQASQSHKQPRPTSYCAVTNQQTAGDFGYRTGFGLVAGYAGRRIESDHLSVQPLAEEKLSELIFT